MKGTKTYIRLPKAWWPKHWAGCFRGPICQLPQALYNHPRAGDFWHGKLEAELLCHWIQRCPTLNKVSVTQECESGNAGLASRECALSAPDARVSTPEERVVRVASARSVHAGSARRCARRKRVEARGVCASVRAGQARRSARSRPACPAFLLGRPLAERSRLGPQEAG